MSIQAMIQPVDLSATKNILISAIRFASTTEPPCQYFGDELKSSAQKQVEYMLGDDEETQLVIDDDEVKCEVKKGLHKVCSSFENEMSTLLLKYDTNGTVDSNSVLKHFSDLEWMCNMVPKMDMMKDFVLKWVEVSTNILKMVEDVKLDSIMWGLKFKLVEVTTKVFKAVGYGNVILPSTYRVQLLTTWLPYIRKLKSRLDLEIDQEIDFAYRMDEELCQSIEGAVVSLVLTLPSNDQADILAEWMSVGEEARFPDLSEAFEVWCYRTKAAKRRLELGNATISL